METNGKVGAVKMKPLYALKKMCEEYSIDRVIGGGLVKRYEMVIDKTIKNKEQELENGKNRAEVEIDNSMFGRIRNNKRKIRRICNVWKTGDSRTITR